MCNGVSPVVVHPQKSLAASFSALYPHGPTPATRHARRVHEWPLMRRIIRTPFSPVVRDQAFRNQTELWMADQNRYPWDTSLLKFVDNW
jgi:hypothetical protein